MSGLARAIWLALWPIGVGLGAYSVAIAREEPWYTFLAGTSPTRAAAELAAGYGLLAVGLFAWARRPTSRFGALLAMAGCAWFLVEWNNPGVGSPFVFTVGLILFLSCPPIVAHAALAYPDGRLANHVERAGLAFAYAGAILVLGLLPALVYDPAPQGCGECPDNLVLVRGDAGAYETFNRVGVVLGLAWSLLLLLLAAWRVARCTPARRRTIAPVVLAACVYLGLVATYFAHSLERGFVSNDIVDRRLLLGEAGALVVLSLGVVWNWVRSRRTRGAVAAFVVELAGSPAPGGLRDALARTLGDPSLQLAYPLEDGRLVDAAGRPVELDGAVTPLVRRGQEVAFLAHRPGLLDDPDVVEEVALAARLALENERLQAEVRVQLDSLRASRARIVEAGDAERQRLERDLHDGAQQHLVALALSLSLARSRTDPALTARFDEAERELREALAELRGIAHGIYPAALAEEGLAAAVEALAEETGAPIHAGGLILERIDPKVEAAAYFVVAEMVRRSGNGPIRVSAVRENGLLVLSIENEDGLPTDLLDVEDRVGALDGRVVVGSGGITAEIPCA